MIERAGTFGANNCVFVKLGKPSQDTRFDVPVFGFHTLQAMKKAGVGSAALQKGSVLLLDKPKLLKEAKKERIGIRGF